MCHKGHVAWRVALRDRLHWLTKAIRWQLLGGIPLLWVVTMMPFYGRFLNNIANKRPCRRTVGK